jgi:drug/metabolite transporter (DMT)-like permease
VYVLGKITPGIASVIWASSIVFSILISAIFLRERQSGLQYVGVALIFAGVSFLVMR